MITTDGCQCAPERDDSDDAEGLTRIGIHGEPKKPDKVAYTAPAGVQPVATANSLTFAATATVAIAVPAGPTGNSSDTMGGTEDPVLGLASMGEEEAALATENATLFARLCLPPTYHGGRHIRAPAEVATRLHTSLLRAFEYGRQTGNTGGLHVRADGRQHVFWGFENYDKVQAPLDGKEQRKWTTMLPVHEVEEASWRALLYKGLDGLEDLVTHARAYADGHMLLACHILQQDSSQACFAWHQDNRNNPLTKVSMVCGVWCMALLIHMPLYVAMPPEALAHVPTCSRTRVFTQLQATPHWQ